MKKILALVVLTVIASSMLYLNGFPLIFSDTGTYLQTALHGVVTADRPVWYGLFLGSIVPYLGINAAVYVQSALTVWLLWLLGRICALPIWIRTTIIAAGLLITTLSWYTAWLTPDIFSALSLMALLVLLFGEQQLGRLTRYTVLVIFSISQLMHYSFPVLTLCILVVTMIHLPKKRVLSFTLGLLVIVTVPVSNLNHLLLESWHYPHINPTTAFPLGHLIQGRVVTTYLETSCPTTPWSLCADRALLGTMTSDEFLWGDNSPFTQTGGWGAQHPDYKQILAQSIRYRPFQTFKVLASDAVYQFFHINDEWGFSPYYPRDLVTKTIRQDFSPATVSRLEHSRQQQQQLYPLPVADFVYSCTYWIGLILLVAIVIRPARPRDRQVAGVIILYLIFNAILCTVGSVPNARYQARTAGIPIIVASMLISQRFIRKRQSVAAIINE